MSGRRFSTLDKVVAKLQADAKKGVHHQTLQVRPDVFRALIDEKAAPGLVWLGSHDVKAIDVLGPHGTVRVEPHALAPELTVVAKPLVAKVCHCLDGDGDAHVHLDGHR